MVKFLLSVLVSASLTALLTVAGGLAGAVAMAEESLETAGTGERNLVYRSLGPPFVTNYDGAGRLRYLKTDISVRVRSSHETVIDLHLPYIRNSLIILLSAQLEENLSSTQGREQLRREALEKVRDALNVLEREGAGDNVINLYFTSFVVQR